MGLRGPGEKQLESDRRQMKSRISALKKCIDSVRSHRSRHRKRRRSLGVPVVALVGYTNSGKSTLLNAFTSRGKETGTEKGLLEDRKIQRQLGTQAEGEMGRGSDSGAFTADMLFATLDPTTRM